MNPDQEGVLREIHAQLTGSLTAGQYPGWPSLENPNNKLTVTDFVRWIDNNVVNTQKAVAALDAKVSAFQTATVAPVATVDLVALAKAVCDEQDRRKTLRDGTAV